MFLSRYPGKLTRTLIVCAQKLLTLNHMTRQKFKFFDASVLIMSESVSVVSDSLQPHGLSMGQNTGVGSLSLLQRIFPTQGSNPGLLLAGNSLPAEPQGKPKNTGVGSLSLLPDPGIEPGSSALLVGSLPTELSEKPYENWSWKLK